LRSAISGRRDPGGDCSGLSCGETRQQAFAFGGQYFSGSALRHETAIAKKSHFGAEGQGVGGVVGGKDSLDLVRFEPGLQAGEKGIAGGAVQGGEGLVQKQETGQGSQRTGQGYALRFAAGEVLRAAVDQVGGTHQIEHFFDASCTAGTVKAVEPVGYICGHAEVREECGLLRHQGCLPAAGGERKAVDGVGEQSAVEGNAAALRAVKSG
jgi:hypothetical protein